MTDTNGIYESALVSQSDVRQAAEWLRRQMQHLISLPQQLLCGGIAD